MLTSNDYLALLREPSEVFAHNERYVLYIKKMSGALYLLFILTHENPLRPELLFVECQDEDYSQAQGQHATLREFITHPERMAHHVILDYPETDSMEYPDWLEPEVVYVAMHQGDALPEEWLPAPEIPLFARK